MSDYLESDDRNFYIYKMYSQDNELLYIGKTTNIEARLNKHFSKDTIKNQQWKKNVSYIDYYEFKTKVDMDIMELYYIALERPKYNKLSTDTEKPRIEIIYKCNEPKRIIRKPLNKKILEINIDKSLKKKMRDNLNVYDGKLNNIGMKENSDSNQPLSRMWFMNCDKEVIKQLKNNMLNYFINITKGKSKNNIWTTFEDYKQQCKGKGYTNGFINPNCELSKFDNCKNFAYLMNKYPTDLEKENEEYANLLTIYDLIRIVKYITIDLNHELNLYVPSERVRNLFLKWLEE